MMALAETGRLVQPPAPTALGPRVARACSAHEAVAQQKGLALSCSVEDVTVPADGERFDQVVDNLLSNAFKFTPAGGRVDVRLKAAPGGAALLEVQDSGAGLDDAQLARLFTAFGRAHGDTQPGLGLGLYLCKAIVDGHRGRITAHSDGPGRGALFCVELPAAAAPETKDLPPRPADPSPDPASLH